MARNAVDNHPKRDEIIEHLLLGDINMKEISRIHSISYDALNWYKRTYLKDKIANIQKEFGEKASDELRELFYKHLDLLNAVLAQAAEDIKKGTIRAHTVKDLVSLVDLATKITGDQIFRVEMKASWGDKMERSPRFGKGKVLTMADLEEYR